MNIELYGQDAGSQPEWAPAGADTGSGLEESMERLSIWGGEAYPERPGVANCSYYMRTGVCKYGARCRYHHPPDRVSVGGAVGSGGGEYPDRIGVPACQHYLRTGTCKFGASCKFHHPKNAGGTSSTVPLNIYGYPLRPGEKECSYYLKTAWCKFGMTCKFHHPQPAGMSMPATARPFYPTVQTLSLPSTDQYGGPSTSYRVARPPLLPGSYVPGTYGHMVLHPGVVPIPNWTTYSGPVSPGAQASAGAASPYGVSHLATSTPAYSGTYPPLPSSSGPSSRIQKEEYFPERPGELECQYYMKTGDCKFGSSCRYHHPPEVLASQTNCALSPLGLPLRPGLAPCAFYLQKGRCKFGPACKFDHPYSPSASLMDTPVASYMFNSSAGTLVSAISIPDVQADLTSEFRVDSHVRSIRSSGSNLSNSVGLMFPKTRPTSLSSSNVLLPVQSSSTISRSTRQDG